MREGARPHVAMIPDYLQEYRVNTTTWCGLTSGFNYMKSLWIIWNQEFYKNGRQYHSFESLQSNIIVASNNMC